MTDRSPPAPVRTPPKEQEIAIPPGPVMRWIAVVTAVGAVSASGLSQLSAEPRAMTLATLAGVVGSGLITALSALVFVSAKPRPASLCGSLWLGATLIRFAAVPGLAVSIYFSTPSVGFAAVLATIGGYLACLAAETATVVRIVHGSLNATPSQETPKP